MGVGMKKKKSGGIKRTAIILFGILILVSAGFIVLINQPAAKYKHNLNLGSRYLLQKDYEGAIRAFTKAIDIEPEKEDGYRGRAEAYMGDGQTELAYQDYLQVERITGESGLAEKKTGITSESADAGNEDGEADANAAPAEENAVNETPPTETPVPATPTPEIAAPDYDSFIQEVASHPENYFIEDSPGNGFYSYDNPGLEYAIGDLDTDGVDEVFFSYNNHGGPYNAISTQVWKWNGSAFELYANIGGSRLTMDFYTTGGIRKYPKNPKGILNPYTVCAYNSETKTYDSLFSLSGVYSETAEPYGSDMGPVPADDGVDIWYYGNGEDRQITRAEYDAYIEPYVPERAHLHLDWTQLI